MPAPADNKSRKLALWSLRELLFTIHLGSRVSVKIMCARPYLVLSQELKGAWRADGGAPLRATTQSLGQRRGPGVMDSCGLLYLTEYCLHQLQHQGNAPPIDAESSLSFISFYNNAKC